jgi:hypothetical protein
MIRRPSTPRTARPSATSPSAAGSRRARSVRCSPRAPRRSSRYCRALDTGRIAFRDIDIEKTEALDPPPADEAAAAAQKEAMMALIRDFSGSGNLVLITHIENITALTGAGAREGEAVIVGERDDGVRVLGRIVFN